MESRVPWLPFEAIRHLERVLSSSARVAEFGGGGSTLWFAHRAASVTTVEHDPAFAGALEAIVPPSCEIRLRQIGRGADDYVHALDHDPDLHYDLILVDGESRFECLEAAVVKLKPGGRIALDDSTREYGAPAARLLSAWPSRVFAGLAPSKAEPGQTTIWTKPL